MSNDDVTINVPSSPADLKELNNGVNEMVNAMYRQDAEKEKMKDILDDMSEKFDIDKKYLRRMAKDAYKQTFDKTVTQEENYQQLYESVMDNDSLDSDDEDSD